MYKSNKLQKMMLTASLLLSGSLYSLAAEPVAQQASSGTNPETLLRYVLAGVIGLLVLVIFVMSRAIKLAGQDYHTRLKNKSNGSKTLGLFLLFSMATSTLYAQQEAGTPGPNSFSHWDVYLLITTVLLLFVTILMLVRALYVLMGIRQPEAKAKLGVEGKPIKEKTWFQRFNETVPVEEEESLDMSHDYDGIRELDNKVPAWWNWAFILSVLFAVVYLYRMFVTDSLPDQFVELAQANEKAAIEKLEYLKKGANNVDENTVKMLDASGIAEGATLYSKNCVACHGDRGQGNTVGPNLTDDYWIHKGSLKDVFYSIKYGWAEKGMKSWKEDFSPGQIAQLASFVKSLKGSNPPGAREKQGERYTEESGGTATSIDSTSANATPAADSVKKN